MKELEDAETKLEIAVRALEVIRDGRTTSRAGAAREALEAIGDTSDLASARRRGLLASAAEKTLAKVDAMLERFEPREQGADNDVMVRFHRALNKYAELQASAKEEA